MHPRLLIILNRLVIGGQAVDTIPLAWYLKEDFEILILFGEKEKDEIEANFLLQQFPGLRLEKIKQLRRTINPLVDIFVFFRILFKIVAFKPSIVHTHGAKSGIIGRLAAWLTRVPIIVHTFHGHFFHSYFSSTISNAIAVVERIICKITTCAIALSEVQQVELSRGYKILPLSKIKIIPLGFSINNEVNPTYSRKAFRDKYGVEDRNVAIGIVGRIVPVKNHSFFIKVIQQISLSLNRSNCTFFFIGDGELRKDIEKELIDLKIGFNSERVTEGSRVILTSWLTNRNEFINGLDIIVLTSLNEGTPLSIIEAEFFRKPVVATNVGGVRDTMVDGVTGFLIDNQDLKAFTQQLVTLIEDGKLRKEMGDRGYEFASTHFSKQQEVEATKQLYVELLRKKNYLK